MVLLQVLDAYRTMLTLGIVSHRFTFTQNGMMRGYELASSLHVCCLHQEPSQNMGHKASITRLETDVEEHDGP